eukprot:TRINITY_DN92152_c0_g1_i1.p1 TRINITY_DN92152_c0_g1~~TRINITY_DN92152_c0_g1_i1.p1  ORF type:complete len:548 (-),score=80.11 TRINITY_DN92152_c0_g1_i1:34-1677(-)
MSHQKSRLDTMVSELESLVDLHSDYLKRSIKTLLDDSGIEKLSALELQPTADVEQTGLPGLVEKELPTAVRSIKPKKSFLFPPIAAEPALLDQGLVPPPTKRLESAKTKQFHLIRKKSVFGKTSHLKKIINGPIGNAVSIGLIAGNAILIGVQTEYMAQLTEQMSRLEPPQSAPDVPAFTVIGCLFNVLFITEMILHFVVDGVVGYFRGDDITWNILDAIVVSTSVGDLCVELVRLGNPAAGKDSVVGSFSILRVLRICRVIRLVRFIRIMKFFRELRMMIYAIVESMKSVCWIGMVFGMMFYLFGVVFTDALTAFGSSPEVRNHPDNERLFAYFGRLGTSLLTLFMAMSGGAEWGEMYKQLERLGGFYCFLFLIYVTISIFAVVNVVTGVFVDSAMQINSQDKEVVVHEELREKKKVLDELEFLFHELDRDGSGKLSREEFNLNLANERVLAYFTSLKLNINEAEMVFDLLDFDQSGELSIDEFIQGCYQLQGEASAIDTKMMQIEVKFLKEIVSRLYSKMVPDGAEVGLLQSTLRASAVAMRVSS